MKENNNDEAADFRDSQRADDRPDNDHGRRLGLRRAPTEAPDVGRRRALQWGRNESDVQPHRRQFRRAVRRRQRIPGWSPPHLRVQARGSGLQWRAVARERVEIHL